MLNDAADVDRLATGLDRNALLQALLTSTQKISYAVPVAIIYPILGLIGFNPRPGAANSDGAILGMTLLFVLAGRADADRRLGRLALAARSRGA